MRIKFVVRSHDMRHTFGAAHKFSAFFCGVLFDNKVRKKQKLNNNKLD